MKMTPESIYRKLLSLASKSRRDTYYGCPIIFCSKCIFWDNAKCKHFTSTKPEEALIILIKMFPSLILEEENNR